MFEIVVIFVLHPIQEIKKNCHCISVRGVLLILQVDIFDSFGSFGIWKIFLKYDNLMNHYWEYREKPHLYVISVHISRTCEIHLHI